MLFRVVCSAVVCGEISCFITEVLILYCSVVGAVGEFLSVEQWTCSWGPLHISLKCSFVIMHPQKWGKEKMTGPIHVVDIIGNHNINPAY